MNNYRYFAVIIIFALLSINPSISNSEELNYIKYAEMAGTALENGELEKALKYINRSINLNQEYAEAYFWRGFIYREFGNQPPELKDVKPPWDKNFDSETDKKRTDLKLKYYIQAIGDFNEAIRLETKISAYYFIRGNTYCEINQYHQAIKDYDKVISIDPNFAGAWLNRGTAYNELGGYYEAIDDLNHAIRLIPNEPKCYRSRGTAYLKLNKRKYACSDFKKACELGKYFFCLEHLHFCQ